MTRQQMIDYKTKRQYSELVKEGTTAGMQRWLYTGGHHLAKRYLRIVKIKEDKYMKLELDRTHVLEDMPIAPPSDFNLLR